MQKEYDDQHNPFECRACGSHKFEAEISGTIDGVCVIETPTIEELTEVYKAEDYEEIEANDNSVEWDWFFKKEYYCMKCKGKGKGIITVNEALDTLKTFDEDVAAGRIYQVHAGQIDLFTGETLGQTEWRRAVGVPV